MENEEMVTITKEEYEKRIKEIKHIDFSKLIYYEQEDNTVGAKEFACVSGSFVSTPE